MKHYLRRSLSLIFGLSIIVAMLLSSVQAVVFNHSFYTSLYEKIDLAQRENISQEDLEESIFMMTDYVEGKRNDLDGHVYWHNHTQPTFNTKEIRHMKDVRELWQKAHLVMRICWGLVLVSVMALALFEKKQCLADLALGFKDGMICFAVLLVFFGFWWLIDFTGFWTWFHTIVFPGNSDWLLNPATDFMIVICPEEMFSTMVFQIAARLVGALVVLGLVLGYFYKHTDDQKDIAKLHPQQK